MECAVHSAALGLDPEDDCREENYFRVDRVWSVVVTMLAAERTSRVQISCLISDVSVYQVDRELARSGGNGRGGR